MACTQFSLNPRHPRQTFPQAFHLTTATFQVEQLTKPFSEMFIVKQITGRLKNSR